MRLVAIALLLAAGCDKNACRDGTLFLTLSFDEATRAAGRLRVEITVDNQTLRGELAHPAGSAGGSIQVTFPRGYPSGKQATVSLVALDGTSELGTGMMSLVLPNGCAAASLAVTGGPVVTVDLSEEADAAGAGDMAQAEVDMSEPEDMATPPDLTPPVDLRVPCPGAPAATATQYVDPFEGSDNPAQGGAAYSCAYKTLNYALTKATNRIVLAPGAVYSNTTRNTGSQLENLPITLTGTQSIDCQSSAIDGNGTDGTGYTTTVIFAGTENALVNCVVKGDNASMSIQIRGLGDVSAGHMGHRITGCDVSGGTNGLYVHQSYTGNNTFVTDSTFHDCGSIAIYWYGPTPSAQVASMINNRFLNNYSADVGCGNNMAAGVTGNNNRKQDTGLQINCYNCLNCNFGPN